MTTRGRKKKQHALNHERWLVSYADLVTLLFALFVVLFASSQADQKKQAAMARAIQAAFVQMGIFEGTQKRAIQMQPMPDTDVQVNAASAGMIALQEIERRIKDSAKGEIASGAIAVTEKDGGLVVSLREAGFFDSGAAEIHPSALPVLDRIAAVLPPTHVRVEGHSDNVPISTAQYASNWELSSSRASSVARILLHHANVHAEELSVAGYAEFHPVATNDTMEGRAQNRRVDLIVAAPDEPAKLAAATGGVAPVPAAR